jgi:GNAT superfamily N-acetyltransferase
VAGESLSARISALVEGSVRALADEVRTVPGGWAVRTRDLPAVWTLNQVHLEAPTTAAAAVALADEHQKDLPYRYIVVDDEASGRQRAGELGNDTWTSDREVLMVLATDPRPPVAQPPSSVQRDIVVLDEAQATALMRRWVLEAHADIAPNELEEVLEYHRREGRLWNERCFGYIGEDGTPANMAKLRSDGRVASVEDVYTRPEERRRGLARAVVTFVAGLARAERPEFTFLLADDDDWPKQLYARIGFAPVGMRWTFRGFVPA